MMFAVSASLAFRKIIGVSLLLGVALAADPYVYYDWTVSYITAAPLGVKQQVCYSLLYFISFCNWSVETLD